jgi:hypothetical protein
MFRSKKAATLKSGTPSLGQKPFVLQTVVCHFFNRHSADKALIMSFGRQSMEQRILHSYNGTEHIILQSF